MMQIKSKIGTVLFILYIHVCNINCSFAVSASIIGALGVTLYQSFDTLIGCRIKECCEKPGNGWLPGNITGLKEQLDNKLYGQHLVDKIVIKALMAHLDQQEPSKALVMSFHGWSGSGKNYAAKFIAESIYYKGLDSKYVHLFVSTISFPHADLVDIYKLQIQDWIRGNVSKCAHSLFIFDEIDKMPIGMIDAIKPFIDYHENIFGVDFRKSIFIFLSNTGSRQINKRAVALWKAGRERLSITLTDIEDIVEQGAFNEQGGLHNSDLIQHSLVDFFVPFLPLERRHIESCIRDEIYRRKRKPHEDIVNKVLNSLTFFPPESQLFSTTGCKRVSSKVGYFLADEMYDALFD